MQKNTNQSDTVDFTVTFSGIPRKHWYIISEFQSELAKLVLGSSRKIGLNEIVTYKHDNEYERDMFDQIFAKVTTLLHFQSQENEKT